MRSVVLAGLAFVIASCGSPDPAPQTAETAAAATHAAEASPAKAHRTTDGPTPTSDLPQVSKPIAETSVESGVLIKALGTEPFWAINVMLGYLTYRTPEAPGWTTVKTELSEQDGGLRYTGKLNGKDLVLTISKGTCSDGMSDNVYPLTATLTIGTEKLRGCAKPN